jgi:hypothetical protein
MTAHNSSHLIRGLYVGSVVEQESHCISVSIHACVVKRGGSILREHADQDRIDGEEWNGRKGTFVRASMAAPFAMNTATVCLWPFQQA